MVEERQRHAGEPDHQDARLAACNDDEANPGAKPISEKRDNPRLPPCEQSVDQHSLAARKRAAVFFGNRRVCS
jgi:hypothetical protein